MSEKKVMQPISLQRLIQFIVLSIKNGELSEEFITRTIYLKKRRSRSLLKELVNMDLLDQYDKIYKPNANSLEIYKNYIIENWTEIHEVLFTNNAYYRIFIEGLNGVSKSKDEILRIVNDNPIVKFNITTIENLMEWSERLGKLQKNIHNGKFYLVNEKVVTNKEILTSIQKTYDHLNLEIKPGVNLTYVGISKLREQVCELIKIPRSKFNKFLITLYSNNIGKMELSSAPINTSTKESRYVIRKIQKNEDDNILPLKYTNIAEGQGLVFSERLYQYIAIFEKLS